jgi:hypothetical protein
MIWRALYYWLSRRAQIGMLAVLLLFAGCTATAPGPRPGLTRIGNKPVILPATLTGNALIVAAKGGRGGYHFLVDTGSSRTLVSPEFAAQWGDKNPDFGPRQLTVTSAAGKATTLPTATLTRLSLGGARFEDVPVLVYDCSALSEELGVKIDGILGFSLFRQVILTLDYPHSKVILRSIASEPTVVGTALPLTITENVPVITVRLDNRPFNALIDSGREAAMSVNRSEGAAGDFGFGPIDGLTVHDVVGDHRQRIGRLKGTLYLGSLAVSAPISEVTDDLSALGGGLLKNFTVTFDQDAGRVTFDRNSPDPVAIPAVRSAGLSFSRTPAYWRVAGVVPGSPADRGGVASGDLVTKIDGQPVSRWDKARYDGLLQGAGEVRLTFLHGNKETDKTLAVTELVP